VVLVDVSDNAGGGAPGDATFLLRALLARGLERVAAGIFWDPVAVRFAQEAGQGTRLALRLGGKCGPVSGDPLDLDAEVMLLGSDMAQTYGGARVALGDAVWLRLRGEVDLLVSTVRTQTYHPDAFTNMGIDLAAKRTIVVKSSQHYRAGFAPIAHRIVPVATPGAITPNFAHIPYRRLASSYWPRVADPFAGDPSSAPT
jgi:microcystin degradation protein MlrC